MSRSHLPLTPAMSGELVVMEQPCVEGVESFALPPAALSPAASVASRRNSSRNESFCPPIKRPLEDLDLPPPPTRTRKIIQMKPKPQSTAPKQPAIAANSTTNNNNTTKQTKEAGKTPASGGIARKTAHSLIERRRRSKMNEEFSTLKNMIPACRGQEMHKLAILQASIDYVNYLEQCIQDLKAGDSKKSTTPPSPTSPNMLAGPGMSTVYHIATSPQVTATTSAAATANPSPSFSPRSRAPSRSFDFVPTTILPSPALAPSRSHSSPSDTTDPPRPWATTTTTTSATTSPAMAPQRGSISSYSLDTDIDHEASAALLMLNRDRRGTADSIADRVSSAALDVEGGDAQRKMGMSVRDLLIS
ncbi:hypothetical protein ASPZODRAFT_1030901 [Penicilliopsis zonata CBS 506.65]|uniref:BHLH domain-containing protein n=1 Tax=Penicilliopsis zonata CBS 506.65 TaxID=1073090 RepID=A0A1L9SRK7_9EURO|nr:hypothetical protein ASPZODRAFT_1030901 [Penicilliopsis zonata CBS 506.65]OJJ49798.1 hypothetical protein ASPZODRAFT_1030901 [Penicilliopsis zonata CBS 506.65]